jgi:hypothetical protein
MQSIGINRAAFNPGQMMQRAAYAQAQQPQSGYAQSRPVPTFQPAINPNVQRSSANAADPAKPTDYQRMRDELDQLRAWQSQYTGNNGGGGGGN